MPMALSRPLEIKKSNNDNVVSKSMASGINKLSGGASLVEDSYE
jgi:hypothetical protein